MCEWYAGYTVTVELQAQNIPMWENGKQRNTWGKKTNGKNSERENEGECVCVLERVCADVCVCTCVRDRTREWMRAHRTFLRESRRLLADAKTSYFLFPFPVCVQIAPLRGESRPPAIGSFAANSRIRNDVLTRRFCFFWFFFFNKSVSNKAFFVNWNLISSSLRLFYFSHTNKNEHSRRRRCAQSARKRRKEKKRKEKERKEQKKNKQRKQ